MRTLLTLGSALLTGAALAQVATFEEYDTESFHFDVISGGITFTNLDQNFPWGGTPHEFAIEDASADLTGLEGFSPNMALGFGGYSPGSGSSFGRLKTFDFFYSDLVTGASLQFFSFGADAGSTVTLEGWYQGGLVDSATINLPAQWVINSQKLSLDGGVYDSFRVVAGSPTNDGTVFGLIDTVSVTPVPEPATMAVLGLGALAVAAKRRRNRR